MICNLSWSDTGLTHGVNVDEPYMMFLDHPADLHHVVRKVRLALLNGVVQIMKMHPATSAPATSSLGLKTERRTAGEDYRRREK